MEGMEFAEPYAVGIISLLVFVLIVLVQGALVGGGKAKAGITPGSAPEVDYASNLYRLNRSHQNGTENVGAAGVALLAAMLAGASAWWVNLLMVLFLIGRIAYVVIYAQAVGKPTQGLRTAVYVFSWAMLVLLCLMAILRLV